MKTVINMLGWVYCQLDYYTEKYNLPWIYYNLACPIQDFMLYLEDKYYPGEPRG